MTTCMDYNLTVLLYENAENLRTLITEFVADGYDKRNLEKHLTVVIDYLKHGYSVHLDSSLDAAHLTRRALVGDIDDMETLRKVEINEEMKCVESNHDRIPSNQDAQYITEDACKGKECSWNCNVTAKVNGRSGNNCTLTDEMDIIDVMDDQEDNVEQRLEVSAGK